MEGEAFETYHLTETERQDSRVYLIAAFNLKDFGPYNLRLFWFCCCLLNLRLSAKMEDLVFLCSAILTRLLFVLVE
ncbi:hypothetical protein V6N13_074035 [Hibiscus sabdariffa]